MQDESLRTLNTSELKSLENILEKNYGSKFYLKDFTVLQGSEEKIWVASGGVIGLEMEKLAVNSVGMYFGKLKRNEKIHLSIEGCQIIGKIATKNILNVEKEIGENFLKGGDIKLEKFEGCELYNFIIIKSGHDFLGSGLLNENGITNLTPKSRRLPL